MAFNLPIVGLAVIGLGAALAGTYQLGRSNAAANATAMAISFQFVRPKARMVAKEIMACPRPMAWSSANA